jgi:hypothetical protein
MKTQQKSTYSRNLRSYDFNSTETQLKKGANPNGSHS